MEIIFARRILFCHLQAAVFKMWKESRDEQLVCTTLPPSVNLAMTAIASVLQGCKYRANLKKNLAKKTASAFVQMKANGNFEMYLSRNIFQRSSSESFKGAAFLPPGLSFPKGCIALRR